MKEKWKKIFRSEKSLKAYSNGHEIIAIANLFKMRANIFTFKKEEYYWSSIYPDPDFGFSSNMEPQGVSDLFLYHSYNNHYDLLVEPENFPWRFLDRFPNGEMIGNRDDDSPKAKQKDCTNEKFYKRM